MGSGKEGREGGRQGMEVSRTVEKGKWEGSREKNHIFTPSPLPQFPHRSAKRRGRFYGPVLPPAPVHPRGGRGQDLCTPLSLGEEQARLYLALL